MSKRAAVHTLVLLQRHGARGCDRLGAVDALGALTTRSQGYWRRLLFLDAIACAPWLFSRVHVKDRVVPHLLEELTKVGLLFLVVVVAPMTVAVSFMMCRRSNKDAVSCALD